MIDPVDFVAGLQAHGLDFVTGVPDSLLKDFCSGVMQRLPAERHVVATNEGSAIGLAIGHFLATGRPAVVYMQNSGLGNAVNPLASLADPLVCGIPMLLLVGWRGEVDAAGVQIHDEPQHARQGRITLSQLDVLDIPYRVIGPSSIDAAATIGELAQLASQRHGPVALIVRKQTFSPAPRTLERTDDTPLSREAAITAVIEGLPVCACVVATTGMASRELFELRRARGQSGNGDFLVVGGMGHALPIASGIAMAQPERPVVCLDGDGALLMHMGGLVIGARLPNLIHIVLNNRAHDSVGGQPTPVEQVAFTRIAAACGYDHTASLDDDGQIRAHLGRAIGTRGSHFVEIRCRRGARSGLGRPDRPPADNKARLMAFLRERESP